MLTTKPRNAPAYSRQRRRRFSPLQLIGMSVTALIVLIAGGVLIVLPRLASHAAVALDMNCTLIVPPNPLTAKGLSTPYQFVATDPAQGPCNESNIGQSAFVQAVIFDKATSTLSAYEPLIIDQGTQPAAAPVVPVIPAGSVVGLAFGFNATILHLAGDTARGHCVNGSGGTDFGQFAYCNTPAVYQAANAAIAAKTLTVPAIGMATDGKPCMTVRDFSMVDMDQSDNVQTLYLANGTQIAQLNTANQAALPNATTLGNPSDNKLLTSFLNPALGCTSWQIPNLSNNGAMTPTMVTDELQAAANQKAPVARIPAGDAMVLVNNAASLAKLNAYRRGVDQRPAATLNDANTTTYCTNLVNVALPRLQLDMANFQKQTSPDGGAATNSLFTFLASRMNATFAAGGLNCVGLLNIQNPIALTTDGNGIVTAATITSPPVAATAAGTGTGTGAGTAAGGVQQVATGSVTINLDTNAGNAPTDLKITYPNHPNQQINVNIATVSCTATPFFTQPEDTDGNGQNNASTVINDLRGLQTLPANWFVTVSDPNQNNMVVGCGSVTVNGATGTATLGTVTAAPATAANAAAAAAAAPIVAAAADNAATAPAPVGAAAAPTHNHKKRW